MEELSQAGLLAFIHFALGFVRRFCCSLALRFGFHVPEFHLLNSLLDFLGTLFGQIGDDRVVLFVGIINFEIVCLEQDQLQDPQYFDDQVLIVILEHVQDQEEEEGLVEEGLHFGEAVFEEGDPHQLLSAKLRLYKFLGDLLVDLLNVVHRIAEADVARQHLQSFLSNDVDLVVQVGEQNLLVKDTDVQHALNLHDLVYLGVEEQDVPPLLIQVFVNELYVI